MVRASPTAAVSLLMPRALGRLQQWSVELRGFKTWGPGDNVLGFACATTKARARLPGPIFVEEFERDAVYCSVWVDIESISTCIYTYIHIYIYI